MLQSAPSPKPKLLKRQKIGWLIIGALCVAGVIWWLVSSRALLPNYAEMTAKPIELALQKAGGVRQCVNSFNGNGTDAREPSTTVIYELPGNPDQAQATMITAGKAGGFDLVLRPMLFDHPQDHVRNLEDRTGNPSPYSDLESGEMQLLAEVYIGRIYSGGNPVMGCTLKEVANPPKDKTTIRFTLNMPRLKYLSKAVF